LLREFSEAAGAVEGFGSGSSRNNQLHNRAWIDIHRGPRSLSFSLQHHSNEVKCFIPNMTDY